MLSPVAQIPPDAIDGVWMRCPSTSGGKDWVCFQIPSGVETHWGKTGLINQLNRKNGGKLSTLVSQKFRKGYQYVGKWSPNSGWTTMDDPLDTPDKPKNKEIETTPAMQEWMSAPDVVEWF